MRGIRHYRKPCRVLRGKVSWRAWSDAAQALAKRCGQSSAVFSHHAAILRHDAQALRAYQTESSFAAVRALRMLESIRKARSLAVAARKGDSAARAALAWHFDKSRNERPAYRPSAPWYPHELQIARDAGRAEREHDNAASMRYSRHAVVMRSAKLALDKSNAIMRDYHLAVEASASGEPLELAGALSAFARGHITTAHTPIALAQCARALLCDGRVPEGKAPDTVPGKVWRDMRRKFQRAAPEVQALARRFAVR